MKSSDIISYFFSCDRLENLIFERFRAFILDIWKKSPSCFQSGENKRIFSMEGEGSRNWVDAIGLAWDAKSALRLVSASMQIIHRGRAIISGIMNWSSPNANNPSFSPNSRTRRLWSAQTVSIVPDYYCNVRHYMTMSWLYPLLFSAFFIATLCSQRPGIKIQIKIKTEPPLENHSGWG